MRDIIRRAGKRSVSMGFRIGKRALRGHPALKQKLKNVLTTQVGLTGPGAHDSYRGWLTKNTPDSITLEEERSKAMLFENKPLISIIVPTYNTPEKFFNEMVWSVKSQSYQNWELILIDDASPDGNVRRLIKKFADDDPRIRYKFLTKNHHIAGATNEGIKIANGEFISLFDHDDILWPNALYEIASAINEKPEVNFIYTDEDKVDGDDRTQHFDPFFKPDWNFEFLRSVNYITHFTTIRKTILDKFGYEDGKYNGAQDWELFLRITRNIDESTIKHIPKVVYSWRVHENSTAKSVDAKPYVIESQKQALMDDIVARGVDATLRFDKKYNKWTMVYRTQGNPMVSIVIPTKNNAEVLGRCINSILKVTNYDNYEIIIVDTGSDNKSVSTLYEKINKNDKINILYYIEDKFSYSKSCNYGASNAKGNLLMMLNDDTEIKNPNWLEEMGGYAQQSKVGAVGGMLLYPDGDTVQHATVGVGVGEIAANMFMGFKLYSPKTLMQYLMLIYVRNASAVTAACLMIEKSKFDQVNGFDPKLRVNYNDVDLCLRLVSAGYRNVYLPEIEVIHYESISRGFVTSKNYDTEEFMQARSLFKRRWSNYIDRDPQLNDNISRHTPNFDII